MHPYGFSPGALERRGLLGIELAVGLPAHHQIAVALLDQPGKIFCRGDARVTNHQRMLACPQIAKHLFQRMGFRGIAFEQARATHKATPIEHQAEGHQRTIAALLLRAPKHRLRIARALSLEIRVREVIQRDRLWQSKQRAQARKQVILNRRTVLHQGIRCPVQTHQRHGFEVHIDQLPQRALPVQPLPGGQLGGGFGHASNHVADHRRTACPIEPERLELRHKPQLRHRRETYLFHPHRARLPVLHGVHIDFAEVWCRRARHYLGRRRTHHQPPGITLRGRFDAFEIFTRQQRLLATEELFNARAQRRPVLLRHGELTSQVEQGDLAYLARHALGAHQPVGEVGLPGGFVASRRSAHEHPREDSGKTRGGRSLAKILWHYKMKMRKTKNAITQNQ